MWYMFCCGVYNLYLIYTEMYIVDLIKLYYNLLIQQVTAIEFNKLLLLLLLLLLQDQTTAARG